MPFINLPPNLLAMFQNITSRLSKLENSVRFSFPNVSTAPANPRKGDAWLDTTGNSLQYIDSTGATQTIGTAGGSTPTGPAGGDLTGSYPNPTLAAVGTSGTFGSASNVPVYTVDSKGRITATTNTTIAIAPGQVTGTAVITTDSRLSDARTPTGSASGDLTGTYPSPTLAALSPSPAGTYGSATAVPVIVVDAKGRTTSVTTATPTVSNLQITPSGIQLLAQTAANTTGLITAGTNLGDVLIQGSSGPQFQTGVNRASNLALTPTNTQLVVQTAANTSGLLAAGTTGYVLTQGASGPTWAAAAGSGFIGTTAVQGSSANQALTGITNLASVAGTASVAPITLATGTNLTTPVNGSVEYDGNKIFFTPNANTSGRGMLAAIHMVYATTTASITSSASTPFAAANDTISLDANRLYSFKAVYLLNYTFTGGAQTVNAGFTFSNTTAGISYTFKTYNQTAAAQSPFMGLITTAAATAVTPTISNSISYVIELEGMFKSNATTGGTLFPFLQLSGASSSAVVQELSSFQLVKLGTTGTANIAGNWN